MSLGDFIKNSEIMNLGGSTESSGSATYETGAGTFNSSQGFYIEHGITASPYNVFITPTSPLSGDLGEVWVDKQAGSFTVYCTGSNSQTSFDWLVIPTSN